MEDYKKKYDEALERAKNLHKDAVEMENNMTTKTCEIIFPELKESEDEKIRKRILLSLEKDLMATKNSGCNTQDLEQCIIWIKTLGDIDTQWKPNEKQLTALRRVKNAVGGEGELYNPLNQLYEDLIKL